MYQRFIALLLAVLFASPPAGAADTAAAETQVRKQIYSQARIAASAQDFAALESQHQQVLTRQARTPSGIWQLKLFSQGVASQVTGIEREDEPWQARRAFIQQWLAAYPQSPSAHIAHVDMLISRAWSFRGTGMPDTVAPEDWKPFKEHIALAEAYLLEHASIRDNDPRWFEQAITVAMASGNRQRIPEILSAATARFPTYYNVYFATSVAYLPKWGGSEFALEKLAIDAVSLTQHLEQHSLYARIYWYAAEAQYGDWLFQNSDVNWKLMKKGFEDMLALYPSPWNLNHYAKFSCLVGDRDKARELMARLDEPVAQAWSKGLFDRCQQWLAQGNAT